MSQQSKSPVILEKLRRVVHLYAGVEDNIVAVALGISALMGFLSIILRYFIKVTVWEIFPVQHYTFLFAVLLGAGIASRKQIHVRVEVLDTLLKRRPVTSLAIRTSMLFVAFASFCIFTYLSYGFMVWAWEVRQTDTILTWFHLGVVKTLPFVLGVVSSVAFGVYTVKALRQLRAMRSNRGEDL